MAFCKYIPAKAISYGGKRSYNDVKAIVIHYTGNKRDTAVANANYFVNSNHRAAGAHYFVDRKGTIVKSIKMKQIAYSVGGGKYPNCSETGGGKYYGVYKNSNTISIELCDVVDRYPSDKQIKSVKKLVKHIRKYCPNAKAIIRHFDVNGKDCPARMAGKNNEEWKKFKKSIQ